jgi:hypothetical protein
MNTAENLKLSGRLNIELHGPDGALKDAREVDNLVVSAGLAYIASRMTGTAKGVMTHMGLGSGTTAAAAGQTDLVSLLGAREAIDTTTLVGANLNQVQYVCGFEAGDATGAVTEAGIFNASSGGDMLCRTTFAVVNKDVNDTLTITWTITLSAV